MSLPSISKTLIANVSVAPIFIIASKILIGHVLKNPFASRGYINNICFFRPENKHAYLYKK